jgi:two-component system CheB/CheR fusion protein
MTNDRKNSQNDFYIVSIGASAGGLEAIEQFFDNMPANSGMAFVVIQHLSPDYKSMMVEILSKHTDMPVLHVEDGALVQPNHVYLIPRKKNITLFHNKLFLTEKDLSRGFNLPIDIFFISLAKDQGQKAIAIVLSGTGSDGTRGIRAIKENDGMVIVQDPTTAKFNGMPNSAIATGLSDYILPPHSMPEELLKFILHPDIAKTAKNISVEKDENTLFKILSLIREQLDVDFTEYKETTVIRRIERRMGINQIEKMTDYLRYLHRNSEEIRVLYKELLIGVTNFFRDPEAFEALYNNVILKIINKKTQGSSVRVWVAACSTGEEAYSIAILLAESIQKLEKRLSVKIFATDIDKKALEYASIGIYPESIAADISAERLHHFFVKKEDKSYQVSRQIRQMVIFAPHNLAKDPPFVKIDLVTCRNLFIYFQSQLQDKVLKYFHFSLKQQGFLFLGSSETIGDNVYLFSSIDSSKKIYQYKSGYHADIENLPNLKEKKVDIPAAIYTVPKYNRLRPITPEKQLSELISEALAEEYVPACIVTNENLDVLHIHGHLEAYLKFPQGQMTVNLTKILRQDISMILSTAAHNVVKHHKKLLYHLQFKVEEDVRDINLHVQPLRLEPNDEQAKLLLIVFEELEQQNSADNHKSELSDISSDFHQRLVDLERELQYTRETLQATIEELETSNEELQATNEELLAANEELQSTNEELQAVNEELMTVNSEYQYKIQQVTALNDDFNNLLYSINIGILLLDKELCVKHYTKEMAKEIYLMNSDVGRPIQHISQNLKNLNLLEHIHLVLEKQQQTEMEVENQQGQWFSLCIAPYITADKTIEGVVITLVDITDQRYREKHYRTEKAYQQTIAQLQQ